jgi:hypothetical protein
VPTKKRVRAHATRTAQRRAAARRRSFHDRIQQRRESQLERRRRLRNRILTGLGVAVVITGVTLTILWWPPPKEKIVLASTLVSATSDPLAINTPPVTMKLAYQIEVKASTGEITNHYQEITLRRPFDDNVIFYVGQAPASSTEYKAITNMGLSATSTTDAPFEIRSALPVTSEVDVRFDVTLDDLINNGFYQRRERRELLGRQCTMYRTGRTVQNQTVAAATAKDYADICIDDSGLVLEEIAVTSGKLSLHVTAKSIDTQPTLAGDEFNIVGTPLTNTDGAPEMVEIDANTSPADGFLQLSQVPDGYTHVARYRYRDVPSQDESAAGITQKDTYVDVYQNGTRAIIIHQGKIEYEPQQDHTDSTKVTVGALGDSDLQFTVLGPTIFAAPAGTWFVHVFANMSAKDIQEMAANLH